MENNTSTNWNDKSQKTPYTDTSLTPDSEPKNKTKITDSSLNVDNNSSNKSSFSAASKAWDSKKDSADNSRCQNFEVEEEYEIGIAPKDKM